MTRIVVTGGAGFIGSNLVDALIKENHEVVVVDNLSTGRKENLNPQAKFYQLDILDQKLAEVFENEKPQVVFHLAAQIDIRKSVADPITDAKINIFGSLNLLENCKNFGVKKIIFSSSCAVYGESKALPISENETPKPLTPYGIAKLTIEYYLDYYYKIFNLPYVILRYANVYGPRQNSQGEAGVIAIFCSKLLSGQQPIINGDGKQTRDYVYVDDVVKANLLALDSKKVGIYNIGTGTETDVNQIAELIKKEIKSGSEFVYGPAKAGEQMRSCLDYSLVKKELSCQPKVNLTEGIKRTVEYFKNEVWTDNI